MYIGDDKVKEIISKLKVSDVISNYIDIIPKGKDYKAICPFHNDTNPSLSISDDKGIYKCFVCGKGGNAINFVMEYNQISFVEASKICADMAGVELDVKIDKNQIIKKKYYNINAVARDFFQVSLQASKEGVAAYQYLQNRGLSKETIDKFQIGYSIDNHNLLKKVLNEKDFSDVDLFDVGLIGSSNSGYYDSFRNRIMFPLFDDFSNVVGFSGRIFQGENLAKYVNSKETKIFKKNELLYNLNTAKNDIVKSNSVLILEGFMDVIALDNIGIKNSVATMGTALTNNHIEKIVKLTKNITLLFDGDKAGIEAANKAILKIDKKYNVKICVLPDNLDPDEYVRKYSKAKFLEYLDTKLLSITDFKYLYLTKNIDKTDIDAVENAKINVFNLAKSRNSESIANVLIERFSKDFLISKEALINDYNNIKVIIKRDSVKKYQEPKNYNYAPLRKNNETKHTSNNIKDPYVIAETAVTYHMTQDKEFTKLYNSVIGIGSVVKENYKIRQTLIVYYSSHDTYNYENFVAYLSPTEKIYFDNTYQNYELATGNNAQFINNCYTTLRKYFLKQQIEYNKNILKDKSLSEDISDKCHLKISDLRKMLQNLNNEEHTYEKNQKKHQ